MTTQAAPAPQVDASISDLLISDAPDDLEFDGPADRAEREPGKLSDLKPEDFDEDDESDAEPEPPKAKAKPKDEPPKEKDKAKAADVPKEPVEEPEAKTPWPKDRGTREKPLTIKDLPDDVYVQVKVDGKQDTVSLKEYAQGIIRMESFHGAYNKANQAYQDATEIAQKSLEERQKIRDGVKGLFKTPKQMFDYYMEHYPDEAVELGRMIALQFKEWNETPGARETHKAMIRERQLAAERERFQRERENWERGQHESRAKAEAAERFRPAHNEAMKEAGFPKITEKFKRTMHALLNIEQNSGQPLTPERYKEIFAEALSIAKPEDTVAGRKPPPSADPPRRPNPSRPANGKTPDWNTMSHRERLRHPEFFLR